MKRLLAALFLCLAAGCAQGDIRHLEYTDDLPSDVLAVLRGRPEEPLFVENAQALPMFYLQHGELRAERRPPGYRATWRAIYLSGFLAQRYYDANFDAEGRNLSYRVIELWLVGLGWRYDSLRWRDATGRARRYLDATVLFGAFGYSVDDDDRDIVLLWIPVPLP